MTTRTAELLIKARNESGKALSEVVSALKAMSTAQRDVTSESAKTGSAIDNMVRSASSIRDVYRGIKTSVDQTSDSYKTHQGAIRATEAQLRSLKTQARELEKALQDASLDKMAHGGSSAAVNEAKANLEGLRAEIDGVGGSLDEQRTKFARYILDNKQAADRLRASLDPMIGVNDRLNKQLAETSRLYRAGAISSAEYGAAKRKLRGDAVAEADALAKAGAAAKAGSGGGLFGLRPYELQNLSYQVNDVITQLASGTSLTQTLGQQGGQVFQLFQRQLSGFVGLLKNPAFLGAAASFGLVYVAMKRVFELKGTIREFNGELAASADGIRYNAAQLALATRGFEGTGASADQARKAVREFVTAGLDQSAIGAFVQTAKNLAKVTGEDIPTAAKSLAEAFRGGYEQVAKLDDQLNFLTAAQRAQIKAMFDAGDAAHAQALAFDILTKKVAAGAKEIKGPWEQATKDMGEAWRGFLDWLGRSGIIQTTIKEIEEFAKGAKYLGDQLDRISHGGRATTASAGAAGGGLAGGVQRLPDAQIGGKFGGDPLVSWTKPAWMGGKGGRVDVTADIAAIVRTVILEARTGDAQGQRDVAAVILNRAGMSGKSPLDVVTQPGQFEPVGAPGSAARKAWQAIDVDSERFQKSLANILSILDGSVVDPTKGATHFLSPGGQAAKGRPIPAWADPSKMTAERGGHQFFNLGGFPGMGAGGPNGDTTAVDQQRLKIGLDLIRQAQERNTLEQKANDASRINLAGLQAQREAQNANADAASVARLKAIAEENERFKITTERAAQEKELSGAIAANTAKALNGQESIADRWRVVNHEAATLLKQVDELDRRGLKGAGGKTLEELRQQIEANKLVLTNMTTQKWLEEQIAAAEKERADKISDIQTRQANGAITRQQALAEMAAVNADLVTRMKGIADQAAEFGKSIRSAKPDPALEAFISRMQTLGTDMGAQVVKEQAQSFAIEAANLTSRRASAVDSLTTARDEGDLSSIQKFKAEAEGLNDALIRSLQAARDFWAALGPANPDAAAAVAQIDAMIAKLNQGIDTTRITAAQVNQMIAQGATNALDQWAQAIANGENAVHSLWDSFRAFASDFLHQIAIMILQTQILNMLKDSGFGGSGIGKTIADAANAVITGKHHTGGIAGQARTRMMAPAAWFADAKRFHNGGMAGLQSNEVPAILQRGEEVLTAADPRHVANGGGRAGAVRIINTFEPGDFLSKALDTPAGERAILNFITNNPSSVKAAIG